MLRLAANVFYDSASKLDWNELNETAFIERVLTELRGRMQASFDDYRFYIFSAQDPSVRPDSLKAPSTRKILIFISEETSSVPLPLASHYLAIFKSYLPRELPESRIFSFPLGYMRDVPAYPVKPVEARGISVFFSGNLNSNRLQLYRELHPVYRRLPNLAYRLGLSLSSRGLAPWMMPRDLSRVMPGARVNFTSGFAAGRSPQEYGQRLADSKIALCPRGWVSPETFRHFEALRAGTIVVSESLPQTHFYAGSPIIAVRDWRTGLAEVAELIRDGAALSELHAATTNWWRAVCSERATAEFMRQRIAAATAILESR